MSAELYHAKLLYYHPHKAKLSLSRISNHLYLTSAGDDGAGHSEELQGLPDRTYHLLQHFKPALNIQNIFLFQQDHASA